MKVLVLTVFIILLFLNCFAEINLNFEFSFQKLNYGLTNLELYDYDGNGTEEIFAVYNGDAYNWELACYSSTGDTLYTHTFYKENYNEKIKKFKILEDSNELLVISAFGNLYCRLVIYNLNNLEIITSITDLVSNGAPNSIDVTSFAISDLDDGKIIFIFFDGNGMYANRMKKYLYTGSEILYLDEYNTIYSSFIYDLTNNMFYSSEFHHDYEYWSGPGGYESTEDDLLCNIKSYSNELISQINTVFEISGFMHSDSYGDFYTIDYPIEFMIIQSGFAYINEPKLIFYRLADGFGDEMIFQGKYKCFTSDFSEIIWEQDLADVSQIWDIDEINLSSTILVNQIKYFITYRSNNEIIVRSLNNGDIIASDFSSINPFISLTKSDSTNIFIEEIGDTYYAYSVSFDTSVINTNISINKNSLTNYPNPFNPSTTISFALTEESDVELIIYNVKGAKIRTIFNGHVPADQIQTVIWDGNDTNGKQVSSGVYFYKLITETKEYQKKMLLVK